MSAHSGPSPYTTEDLDMFRDGLVKFLEAECPPETIERWNHNKIVDREMWTKGGEFGLLGLGVPEEYGGMGADFRHERILIEEFGARGMEGWGVPLHNSIVAPYLIAFGTDEQKKRWLPKVVTGEIVLGIAMTEPGTGSDLQGIRTRARLEGDEWVLNGQKTFISNGQTADLILVVCRTSEVGPRAIQR